MQISFSKMHGLGNDFVVFDAIHQSPGFDAEQIRFLADRRFGIGCDQVLLVERPRDKQTDFYYRIFNADGSEVEQCGNGARCFARFVQNQGLSSKQVLDVGTRAGPIRLFLQSGDDVRVNMGVPVLEPVRIPFLASERTESYMLEVDGQTFAVGAVSMGNPHVVLRVDSVTTAPVEALGPVVGRHPRFPEGVNVGFMEVLDPGRIRLRVYERGAGETLACGTGACAAVVAGRIRGWLDGRVRVSLPGGDLVIEWRGPDEPVWMTGPATHVFDGRIEL